MPKDENGKWLHHPELQSVENDPDATISMLESPEQYLLFVTGGTTHYAHFFYGTYGIATRPVEEYQPPEVANGRVCQWEERAGWCCISETTPDLR